MHYIEINGELLNLDMVVDIYKDDFTGCEYNYIICTEYSNTVNQNLSLKFKTKEERDVAFDFIRSYLSQYGLPSFKEYYDKFNVVKREREDSEKLARQAEEEDFFGKYLKGPEETISHIGHITIDN